MDVLISSFPKPGSGGFYPYYLIKYALIVKDAETLDELNEAAAMSQDGITLENTAYWDGMESGSEVVYSYFPYVDKELVEHPSADNGYVAEFKVIINKYAEDLDPTSDVLAIRDILSDNLRFLPDSLVITPSADSIEVQHDADTNTLTFLNVPDETMFEISYQVRVLGQGGVSYSNTVQFGKYEKTIEENTVIGSSGGGSASNPSITLIKRDADSISTTLAGATFQLFYMQGSDQIPVLDQNGDPVTFTTGSDGSVLIVGNQLSLGWALWTGRTYCLVEIVAPVGYELDTTPTYFVLSNMPASQIEYDITGDQFSIQDTPLHISIPVKKTWIGPEGQSVTVYLMAGDTKVAEAVLDASNNWEYTFEDLDQYDNGTEIAYWIAEEDLPNYSSEIVPNGDGSFTIVNTNIETIDIPVTKQWVGEPMDSVTVYLSADGTIIDSAELTASVGWQQTFSGLPKYDSTDGHKIEYDVAEGETPGYSQGRSGTVETGFTFTNTITGKVSIPVTKVWVGPETESVTVNLLIGDTKVAEAVLDANNNWQYTFTDLEKYQNGEEITYRIEEISIPGYSSEIVPNEDGSVTIVNLQMSRSMI
ncbi:MAG: Cna B-type domain-containing protein [Oscillospiraceae bacterium]|nr:Cna B-type domain-containing protein [Oscillospiraceae bacterium]